jgi:hypothetical protein
MRGSELAGCNGSVCAIGSAGWTIVVHRQRRWLWRTRRMRRPVRAHGPLLYSKRESRPPACVSAPSGAPVRRAPGSLRDLLFSRAPVLFLMVEEAFLLYVAVGLLRAFTGRRTAGLLLRPMPITVSPPVALPLETEHARLAEALSAIETLTILPFSVFPASSAIAKGWIYDLQLWDLTDEEREAVELLRSERRPGERLVLTAIGTQSPHKGFDLFADSYVRIAPASGTRFQFIACGKIRA